MTDEGGGPASEQPREEKATPRRQSLGALASMVIALMAGMVAWAVVFSVDPVFRVMEDFGEFPAGIPLEIAEKMEAALHRVDLQNAMLILAVLGMATGGSLAGCEALVRRNHRRVAPAAIAGAAIGASLGVLGAWLGDLVLVRYGYAAVDTGLNRTLWVQLAMLVTLGLGLGVGIGLAGGLPRLFSASLAGAFGGALAALVYPVLAAVLLPIADTETIIPEGSTNRLLWMAISTGLIGLTIGGLRFTRRGNP